MATYRNLIERSLLEIGVLRQGEHATEAAVTYGFELLKEMLEAWILDGVLAPNTMIVPYSADAEDKTKQIYPVGRGNDSKENPADIVTDTPFKFDLSGGVDAEMNVPPGYSGAIRLGLAVRLAPSHRISASTIKLTTEGLKTAMNLLRKQNMQPHTTRLDPALHQGYGRRGFRRGGPR